MLFYERYDSAQYDMSESESKNEFEYVEPTPVMRYYYDVTTYASIKSVIMSIDELVNNFPLNKTEVVQKMVESEAMPFDWELDNDPVIAKEKLSLLPLSVIAPELEKSSCDLDDMKMWYADCIRGIRLVTKDIHTEECLRHHQLGHEMCDFSTTCPQRFIEKFLVRSAVETDFSKDIYKTAPKREFTIVKNKLALAIRFSVLTFDESYDLMDAYSERYRDFMSDSPANETDSIH
jgi:hypothetical protein